MNPHPTALAALRVSAQCPSPASSGAKDTEWREAFAGVGREGYLSLHWPHFWFYLFLIKNELPQEHTMAEDCSQTDFCSNFCWFLKGFRVEDPLEVPMPTSCSKHCKVCDSSCHRSISAQKHIYQPVQKYGLGKTHHFLIFLGLEIMVIYLGALLFSVIRLPGLCSSRDAYDSADPFIFSRKFPSKRTQGPCRWAPGKTQTSQIPRDKNCH